jgi:hypothetical protein
MRDLGAVDPSFPILAGSVSRATPLSAWSPSTRPSPCSGCASTPATSSTRPPRRGGDRPASSRPASRPSKRLREEKPDLTAARCPSSSIWNIVAAWAMSECCSLRLAARDLSGRAALLDERHCCVRVTYRVCSVADRRWLAFEADLSSQGAGPDGADRAPSKPARHTWSSDQLDDARPSPCASTSPSGPSLVLHASHEAEGLPRGWSSTAHDDDGGAVWLRLERLKRRDVPTSAEAVAPGWRVRLRTGSGTRWSADARLVTRCRTRHGRWLLARGEARVAEMRAALGANGGRALRLVRLRLEDRPGGRECVDDYLSSAWLPWASLSGPAAGHGALRGRLFRDRPPRRRRAKPIELAGHGLSPWQATGREIRPGR